MDVPEPTLDRSHFAVFSSFEEADEADRIYWHSQPARERMLALEMLRRIAYGHDRCTGGFQRVLEIAERAGG
jgi:hypothetical protein